MIRFIPLILAVSLCCAQSVMDTVSTGPSYANQVWYSLPNDSQASAPKNNWDLAFDISGQGASILINSVTGTTLWSYPNGDTTAWSTMDTAGITTWTTRWNSDTSWSQGAFDRYANANDPYDLDWGRYNMVTHTVTGDSIYVIKLANGDYKKLIIQSLSAGVYTFKYANLNGNDPQTGSVIKANYTGRNFAYYSLQNNAVLDREPLSASWDLLFTQYTTFIPTPYTVTGVLNNKGVRVAEAKGVGDKEAYDDWNAHSFSTAINEIGYNWKAFNGVYVIADSLVYFVKRSNGDIWKVIFEGFGGGANGNFIFSKEKLTTSVVEGVGGKNIASLAVYPNPIQGQNINVIYNLEIPNARVELVICDVLGRTLFSEILPGQTGLHQFHAPVQKLHPGTYFVRIKTGQNSMKSKFTVR